LIAADRVRFRSRLDGYDREWSSDTDLRLAFYTNLRPGRYQFRVKASNSRGLWSDEETSLSLVILPFFWQTKAFYISAALAVLALAGVAHWRRILVLRRFQELKHREELAAERARIAADMHDDLGATLTKIAVLGAQGAVQILHKRELARVQDAVEMRAELEHSYRGRFGNPMFAAELGFVDDIIDPADTRILVARHLDRLAAKHVERHPRKHGTMPL